MRQVPIPNNTAPNAFGVELDKQLADGSKALGIVQITDTPSPFSADQILLRVNAWQVAPDGRVVSSNDAAGRVARRAIREMVIAIPRGEYTHVVAEQQIPVAAAALAQIADELPAAPEPLAPVAPPDVAPVPPAPPAP